MRTPWSPMLVIAGLALALVALTWIGFGLSNALDAAFSGRSPRLNQAALEVPIILSGVGSRTSSPFHLAGGTYRSIWSAWGQTPVDPPCTHSVELLAVDSGNATSSSGHVSDLAKLVHVPSTGESNERLINVNAGDYYVDINSACAWQISFRSNQ